MNCSKENKGWLREEILKEDNVTPHNPRQFKITMKKNADGTPVYPEYAEHVNDAKKETGFSTLTLDRNKTNVKKRRRESMEKLERKTGFDRDEYPPAIFTEGGSEASVIHMSRSDNRGAGSTMGKILSDIPDGSLITIET